MQVFTKKIGKPLKDTIDYFFEFFNVNSRIDEYYFRKLIYTLDCLIDALEEVDLNDIPHKTAKEELGLFQSFNAVMKEFLKALKKDEISEEYFKKELCTRLFKILYYLAEIVQELDESSKMESNDMIDEFEEELMAV